MKQLMNNGMGMDDFWLRAVVVIALAGAVYWAATGFNSALHEWLP